MAQKTVNPTRMELSRLSKQLATAKRGHKLLKDKQDELMRQFIELIKKNDRLRKEVEEQLQRAMKAFRLANATINEKYIEEMFILPATEVSLELSTKYIMSVEVPVMHFDYDDTVMQAPIEYGFLNSNVPLDNAVGANGNRKDLSTDGRGNRTDAPTRQCPRIFDDSRAGRSHLWNQNAAGRK